MKALFPTISRPVGYVMIAVALFLPFLMAFMGRVNDNNLLFYKECSKLIMMLGSLLILFALNRNEGPEVEKARTLAMRNAMFFTVLYVFGGMVYRVMIGDIINVDSSSFLVFLLINVLSQEFLIKKLMVDKMFRRGKKE